MSRLKCLPDLHFHKFIKAYLNNLTCENSEGIFFFLSRFYIVVLLMFSQEGSLAFKICLSIFEPN